MRDSAQITLEDAASLDGPSATLLLTGCRGLLAEILEAICLVGEFELIPSKHTCFAHMYRDHQSIYMEVLMLRVHVRNGCDWETWSILKNIIRNFLVSKASKQNP